ncbi:MAG: ParB/RepB/Spo0J family partition protein [Clostridia bacterium]
MVQKKKSGLGKGLDALFLDNSLEEESGSAVQLKINEIEPSKDQPRKIFDDEALQELSDSIKMHGVIQPLLVRPMADGSYQLIAGERRWRAARMAELTEVPVVIRKMDDSEAMELALIENLQREDLSPVEEAQGFALLMSTYNLTQEQVANRVGKSRSAVANILRLLVLPEEILGLLQEGQLTSGHARALISVGNQATILRLADDIITKDLSVRETEKMIKNLNSPKADKPKEKAKPKRDTWYDEMEIALRETIGRKANINVTKGNKGMLEIEFFSQQDLATILELFNNRY